MQGFHEDALRSAARADRLKTAISDAVVDRAARNVQQLRRMVERDAAAKLRLEHRSIRVGSEHVRQPPAELHRTGGATITCQPSKTVKVLIQWGLLSPRQPRGVFTARGSRPGYWPPRPAAGRCLPLAAAQVAPFQHRRSRLHRNMLKFARILHASKPAGGLGRRSDASCAAPAKNLAGSVRTGWERTE